MKFPGDFRALLSSLLLLGGMAGLVLVNAWRAPVGRMDGREVAARAVRPPPPGLRGAPLDQMPRLNGGQATVLPDNHPLHRLDTLLREKAEAAHLPRPSPTPLSRISASHGRNTTNPLETLTAEQRRGLNRLRWTAGKHVDLRTHPEDGSIRFLSGERLEPSAGQEAPGLSRHATTAANFLRKNGDVLAVRDPDTEFRLVGESTDLLGYTQVRFVQAFAGLEVWPATALLQLDRAGDVHLLMGAYVPTPEDISTSPAISMESARAAALDEIREKSTATLDRRFGGEDLIVFADHTARPRLAWRFQVHAGLLEHWLVAIDAQTRDVLTSFNQVCTSATTGTGTDLAGQTRTLNLWSENNVHYLLDASKPMFDAAASDPPEFGKVKGGILYFDNRGADDKNLNPVQVSSASPNGPWPADAVSAAYNTSRAHDYFSGRHGRNSYDNKGGTITVVVNIGFANASFTHEGGVMLVGTLTLDGTGNREFYARSLDVTTHEVGHGVTGSSSKLIYQNQSGALNEAFSDVFGEGAESFFNNGALPDWKLGTGLTAPLRDMRQPGLFNQPERMSEFVNTTQDSGGVHINSGIINRAFYLLVEGLNPGIGMQKAEAIFYRALTTKLQPNSDFIDCRLALVQSAQELHGNGSTEAQKVAAALDGVELFDQQIPPPPDELPEVNATDATLFTFLYQDGLQYLGRRETGADGGGIFLNNFPVASGQRPAVRGDGAHGLVVLANNDAAFVDTQTGALTPFNFVGQVASLGWAADGNTYGLVMRNPLTGQREDRIQVFDVRSGQWTTYDLVSPQLDGGYGNTILFADALDFSPDGRFLIYDALNRITDSQGFYIEAWSIYAIDRSTGQTLVIVPPLQPYNIGNPALAQTHQNLLTFEAHDLSTNLDYVVAQDLSTGAFVTLATVVFNGPSFPGYNGDDRAVVFTDPARAALITQPVLEDGLSFDGPPRDWLGYAQVGVIYRRGAYQSLPVIGVAVSDNLAREGSADAGLIQVTRTGTLNVAVPVTFTLTDTATNGEDFEPIALSTILPAGAATAAIPITPREDGLYEGTETVTLTLQDSTAFTTGATRAGTVTIEDNDADAFDQWLRLKFGNIVVDNPALRDSTWGPDADPDRDLLPNLVEAYLGLDPLIPSAAHLTASRAANGDLIFRWQQAVDTVGLTAAPQWSPDAVDWFSSGGGPPGQARTITVTNLGVIAGLPGIGFQATLPTTGLQRALLRLEVAH